MKLKVKRNTPNVDGKMAVMNTVSVAAPIAKCAVITDYATDAVEVIATQYVEIEQLAWARDLGVFQVQIVLGGYDSKGNFISNKDYKQALVSWSKSQCPDVWEKYNLQNLKQIDHQQIYKWLHDEDAVGRAGRDIWGITDLSSEIEEESEPAVTP